MEVIFKSLKLEKQFDINSIFSKDFKIIDHNFQNLITKKTEKGKQTNTYQILHKPHINFIFYIL